MTSGARIISLGPEESLRRGESRTVRFTLYNEDEEPFTDFGAREFEFFILDPDIPVPASLTDLRANSLVDIANAFINSTTEPFIDVQFGEIDWPPTAGKFKIELWRVDGSNYALARGDATIA